jgi:large subunit ribosomal protein L10
MNRETKAERSAALHQRFHDAKLTLVTEYRGLTAGQLDQLRRQVREASGEYRVAKNTLARRAASEQMGRSIGRLLVGPTAFVFAFQDPVAVAKIVIKFAEDHEALTVKGAVLEGEYLEPAAVKALAELPSREVLISQLLALLQAPSVQLLRLLQEPAARTVRVLDAIRRQRESAAPAATAPAGPE